MSNSKSTKRFLVDEQNTAANFVPEHLHSLNQLQEAAHKCQACDLYIFATQTVFGKGSAHSKIILVGEQPGNKEDLQGEPFVGPAGKLLESALSEAGIDKKSVYLTNAVKHFKFEERGKRRIHKAPKVVEINACRPWLEAEIAQIQPLLVVCMGATALRALFNKNMSVTKLRGQFLQSEYAQKVLVTVHPSSLLRLIDSEERHQAFKTFVGDLKKINTVIKM